MRFSLVCCAGVLGVGACLRAQAVAASDDLATTADIVARYPKTETNATADALVRLAVEMGVDRAADEDWPALRDPGPLRFRSK